MIKTFVSAPTGIMERDPRVVLVVADSNPLPQEMRSRFAGRCFDFGIAEANAVGAAAGMAADDCVPIVYIQESFLASRALEFIRNDICFQSRNVKLVGFAAGLIANTLGPSHHATEVLGFLRSLPGLTILSPSGKMELVSALDAALAVSGPVHVRIGKAYEREVYERVPPFSVGRSTFLRKGTDVTVVATGSVLADVEEACERLCGEGHSVDLINASTIKPFDTETIRASVRKTCRLLVVEEHNVIGGLYSCVAESVCGIGLDFVRVLGVSDRFCDEYGWHQDLKRMNGLSPESIYEALKEATHSRP